VLINKEISVGRYRMKEFALTQLGLANISVLVLGDSAIEIGVMTLQGHPGTFEFGGRYRYSHIWLKTATGWKVRASQLTPILRD
jgi:ketosteroid isomerase-like protein